ncbi:MULTISPECIES: TrbI/VirB10 family protein [Vibrio]|uniref:TrbI/VirB10 family protein n=1 Tax=Vibrio TaxID=662 RepID=UPI0001B93F9B|nr:MULTISPECIES: TrbI/VirB10 family protein [Vibrio]EEX34491.1 IncF plasmid conjugative transfer pilus assembly protein TraB [Vibrio coralliilyticus ATCC BAA-450]MDE3898528.1 conjugal transfer protein TraB [Vibrio sp. CC007]
MTKPNPDDHNAESFSDGEQLNERIAKRNTWVSASVIGVLAIAGIIVAWVFRTESDHPATLSPPLHFEHIIDPGFTDLDQQSALAHQDLALQALTQQLTGIQEQLKQVQKQSERQSKELERKLQHLEALGVPSDTHELTLGTPSSQPALPSPAVTPSLSLEPSSPTQATLEADTPWLEEPTNMNMPRYHSVDFIWSAPPVKKHVSLKTYVPSGSFVTAMVTGGADTNAGVLAQGDTVPLVFQTLNRGILPNGQPSRLDQCTITASAYGEVSSSRGVVRTDKISCVLDDGTLIDQAVKGTAFNFGRNGIRGTTLLKNGDIVQMAGLAGILTGLGETGKALSEHTTLHPLGATQTLKSDQAPLNLLGHAGATVGAKLSDYYIKLAETYHPIVEINPGTVVNIVFLEGFTLTPLNQSGAQEVAPQTSRPPHTLGQPPINPLADELRQEGLNFPFDSSLPQERRYDD